MAKKSQTKAVAKTSASLPAKFLGKAKSAKARAVPLSIGHPRKTTSARPAAKRPGPVNRSSTWKKAR